MTVIEQINEAVGYIRSVHPLEPEVGVILGSGLGNFSKEIAVEKEIPYSEIPHFPVSTVQGHQGRLVFGTLEGKRIVAMAGRFHYYEGYDAGQVVFPVRVLKFLGIRMLMISNAAGAVNPSYQVGDLMIIRDHISFATPNPLRGKNIEELGPRFPDMSEPYRRSFIATAREVAREAGIPVHEGVYFAATGPTFETRAEYLMIHHLGADVVGMSTVQENIAANHMGLPVFAMSVITDVGIREEENLITHEEVLEAARQAEPRLTEIFRGLIKRTTNHS
jgi:purine-nucleoside phosphorylase